jgi:hypothetical protein
VRRRWPCWHWRGIRSKSVRSRAARRAFSVGYRRHLRLDRAGPRHSHLDRIARQSDCHARLRSSAAGKRLAASVEHAHRALLSGKMIDTLPKLPLGPATEAGDLLPVLGMLSSRSRQRYLKRSRLRAAGVGKSSLMPTPAHDNSTPSRTRFGRAIFLGRGAHPLPEKQPSSKRGYDGFDFGVATGARFAVLSRGLSAGIGLISTAILSHA